MLLLALYYIAFKDKRAALLIEIGLLAIVSVLLMILGVLFAVFDRLSPVVPISQ